MAQCVRASGTCHSHETDEMSERDLAASVACTKIVSEVVARMIHDGLIDCERLTRRLVEFADEAEKSAGDVEVEIARYVRLFVEHIIDPKNQSGPTGRKDRAKLRVIHGAAAATEESS